MRQLATYLIFILCFNLLNGQQLELNGQRKSSFSNFKSTNLNFKTVDAKVRSYGSNYKNAEALAERILKDFDTEKDRIRALYVWLCLNISYDMDSYKNGQAKIGFSYTSKADLERKMQAINTNMVNKTLRSKKAICEGYAQTFKQVSEYLGIACKLIGGYAKGEIGDINNPPNEENHAWNAVKINKKWYLVDSTWGAGYLNGNQWTSQFDDFYFFTNPEQFALTHFPTESEWFLTQNKYTKREFYKMPIFKNYFFKNKLKLLSPKFGTIEVTTNGEIIFLLNKIPEKTQLYYAFKGDEYSQKIKPDCNNSQCNFTIPFTKNENSELYIFANQKPILEYSIKMK